jgi:hypothetical protein
MSTSGSAAPPSRKPIAINIHGLTSDGVKSSQKAAESGTAKGKANEKKEKMSDLIREEVVRQTLKKAAKPPAPVTREQKEFISRGQKFDPKAIDPGVLTDEEKDAQWYARTIYKYYQAFPEKLGKMPSVKAIDPSTPGALPRLKDHLAQIQSVMNSGFNDTVGQFSLLGVGTAIEFAWQMFAYGQSWNPLGGMNLSNLGAETAAMYDFFSDEIKEFQILYGWFFEHSLWVRFSMKMGQVAMRVAEKNAISQVRSDMTAAALSKDPNFSDL